MSDHTPTPHTNTDTHIADGFGSDLFRGTGISNRAANLLALSLFEGQEEHIHTCVVGEWMDRNKQAQLVERLEHLLDAQYVNGHSSTEKGVLRALEGDESNLLIDNADEIKSGLGSLYEPMTRQQHTTAHATETTTQSVDCSILTLATPTYGQYKQYEPLDEQLPFSHDELALFDTVILSVGTPPHDTDTQPPTSLDEAKQHLRSANEYEPDFPEDLHAELTETVQAETDADDPDAHPGGPQYTNLVQLARAAARMRHSERVSEEDVGSVMDLVFSPIVGRDPDSGEMDADLLETGTPKSQRDRVKLVKNVLGMLDEEHEGPIPFEDLADTMEQNNVGRDKLDDTLDMLMQKGEVVEPRSKHYCLTENLGS